MMEGSSEPQDTDEITRGLLLLHGKKSKVPSSKLSTESPHHDTPTQPTSLSPDITPPLVDTIIQCDNEKILVLKVQHYIGKLKWIW